MHRDHFQHPASTNLALKRCPSTTIRHSYCPDPRLLLFSLLFPLLLFLQKVDLNWLVNLRAAKHPRQLAALLVLLRPLLRSMQPRRPPHRSSSPRIHHRPR